MQNDGYRGIRLDRVCKSLVDTSLVLAALLCLVIQGSNATAQEATKNSTPPTQTVPKNDDIDQLRARHAVIDLSPHE